MSAVVVDLNIIDNEQRQSSTAAHVTSHDCTTSWRSKGQGRRQGHRRTCARSSPRQLDVAAPSVDAGHACSPGQTNFSFTSLDKNSQQCLLQDNAVNYLGLSIKLW